MEEVAIVQLAFVIAPLVSLEISVKQDCALIIALDKEHAIMEPALAIPTLLEVIVLAKI